MNYFKTIGLLGLLGLSACSNDAQVASYNLSQAADNFKINRRIIFYNGITNDYMLSAVGVYQYRVTFKPTSIIPNPELR